MPSPPSCPNCGSTRCYEYRSGRQEKILSFRMYHCGECMAVFSEPIAGGPPAGQRIDPRFYAVMAEAVALVQDALERLRRSPTDSEAIRTLGEAVKNYAAVCDEWRRLTSSAGRH